MFNDAGPGMIQDPVSILAYLAAIVGAVFQLGRLEALRPLFDRLPPLVWAYFLPMLSTTAGILPDESALYRAMARYLLFRPWLPPDAWKAMGALTGTWIGGSANLLAVGTTLGLSPDLRA